MADESITPTAPVPTQNSAPSAPVIAPAEATPSAPAVKQEVKQAELPLTEPTVLGVIEPTKAEVKAEPEAKPEVKAETKQEEKPEVKTEAKAPEAKPEEKKVEPEAKRPEGEKASEAEKKPAEEIPLPTFDALKIPEGVTLDEVKVGELNKMFGEFEVKSKASHAEVQELRQQLFDRHITEAQAIATKIAEAYEKSWKDQTKGWYDQFIKDPEIGGNRQETTVRAAREFIRRHGGTEEQQTEVRTLMQKTGIGNHPAIIRLFAKANVNLEEGKPIPAMKPPAEKATTRMQRFYKSK